MSNPLDRRTVLSQGAGLAATAALVIPTMQTSQAESQELPSTVVVRWNAKTRTWARRPAGAEFGVVFLSTNDPLATPPKESLALAGDVWRLHPDAKTDDHDAEADPDVQTHL